MEEKLLRTAKILRSGRFPATTSRIFGYQGAVILEEIYCKGKEVTTGISTVA